MSPNQTARYDLFSATTSHTSVPMYMLSGFNLVGEGMGGEGVGEREASTQTLLTTSPPPPPPPNKLVCYILISIVEDV